MYKQGELKGSPNCSPKITRQKGLSMRIFAPTYSEFDATAIETESPRGSTTRKSSIDGSAKSPEMMRTLKSSTGKFTVPDSDKVFKFKCSGEIGGDSLVAGKRVEWKAKFDRPIEELIYPSLQRFDIAGYEKKVQQRQQKTGLHEHHGSAKTPSMIKYFNNHESESQIKLEPIPAHLLPANEEIMYVYTPQWTVKLGDPVKTRSASEIFTSTGGSSSVGGGAASGGAPKYASITEEIDIAGEEYLRERMRASIAEREEEKKRKEKLAMSFLLGLNRRVAVGLDLQPVSLEPLDNAKNLVSLSFSFFTFCSFIQYTQLLVIFDTKFWNQIVAVALNCVFINIL